MMDASAPTIFIVDDEERVRNALARLMKTYGYHTRCFASGREFLLEHDASLAGCALLDLELPEMNGLQIQEALRAAGVDRAVIFVTGRADVPSSVRALKRGAIDFVTKPIDETELLRAIREALAADALNRERRVLIQEVHERLATLTPREREVLVRVVEGKLNKQIAGEFGTQEFTIKVHRARVMRKMGARTLADLVHLAARVGIGESAAP